ncbi:MAG: hypothetical protein IPL75_01510 [Acidobacteria bacterium]|nr:hypothetical protein [Acidobacteriota bacterium]
MTHLNEPSDSLRHSFVEMLFALVVGQLAVSVGYLVAAPGTIGEKSPALSHLALCLLTIAMSWLGWKRSQSAGTKKALEHIRSIAFVVLLSDVVLVILYYLLVLGAEVKVRSDSAQLEPASAVPEAIVLVVVFVVFLCWDLIVDILSPCRSPRQKHWLAGDIIRASLVCGASSAVGLLLVVVVALMATTQGSAVKVMALDACLLTALVLHRTSKVFEHDAAKAIGIDCWPGLTTARPALGYERGWTRNAVLFACYIIAFYWSRSEPGAAARKSPGALPEHCQLSVQNLLNRGGQCPGC